MSRPLPQVGGLDEDFWTGGADGELRFRQCDHCQALLHPPVEVCRYCRSDGTTVTAVAGTGVVVGVTVNHHQWDPGFPPPFIVATVAIDEDPRVRVLTNLVDVDPDDVAVGMRVQVRFERIEDVWLPLFAPIPGAEPVAAASLPTDEIEPGEHWKLVRPMLRTEKFEDKVAVTGIGMSDVGRRLMREPMSLTVQAARRAVADAGLGFGDIDGLSTYPGGPMMPGFSEGGVAAVEDALGIRPSWYNAGHDTFGPSGSVIAAMLAVATGLARHVLCFRTVWQSTFTEQLRGGGLKSDVAATGLPSGRRASGDFAWQLPYGVASAAINLALPASYHFARYGTTRETLGWIALNARANAAHNPSAIYREALTMDDYLSARMITTPLGLYDCDVPCDGAVAVIVSALDAARDLAKPPVLVDAVGTQITERTSWTQSTLSHEPQTLGPSAHLWTRTSLRPDDVDVAQLYDGFSFNCLSWLEALGFCGIGEAKDFLDGGHNIALDGQVALNTGGGQLSGGRLHGMGFVHEAVVQLRGDGGGRQVADAKVAVVSSGGLTPAGVMLLRRDG